MSTTNHVRSLYFWRHHRPGRLEEARERARHTEECPICHNVGRLWVTGLADEADDAIELLIDCACQAIRYEEELSVLASGLDAVPESPDELPTLAELAHRDHPNWDLAVAACHSLSVTPYRHPWIFLSGPPGIGKTHMLLATRALLPGLAAYVFADELSQMIFHAMNAQNLDELIADLVSVPVLLLDDLGTEWENGAFIINTISNVLNRRFFNAREHPTVISTNLLDEQFKERYPRVASRLEDSTLVSRFSLPLASYRPHKGGALLPIPPAEKYGFQTGSVV